MKEIEIVRCSVKEGEPMVGVMLVEGEVRFLTLEPPWRGNERGVSCIPDGVYVAKRVRSERFREEVYRLQDVPDREGIEFHVGNRVKETEGCILVGETIGRGEIYGSRKAFDGFMELLKGEEEIRVFIRHAF